MRTGAPRSGPDYPCPWTLRLAHDEDWPAVTALFEATWLSEKYPAAARSLGEVGPFLRRTPMTQQWIAVVGSTVVGHVALRPARGYEYAAAFSAAIGITEDDINVICRLAVHPNWRGGGVARRPLAMARLDRRVALDSIAVRVKADALYASLGFVPIGTLDYSTGGTTYVKTLWVDRLAHEDGAEARGGA